MDTRPALPAPSALATFPNARLHGQWALLERLAEFGVQIAEAMVRQLKAPSLAPHAAPAPKLFQGDIALAYARVSRAVRLTVALQMKLMEELVQASRPQAAQAVDAEAAASDSSPETDPKEAAEAPERPEAVEALDRPDREAPDDIHALLKRPTEEVIALICRDLGVSPEWAARARAEGWQEETELDDFDEPLTAWRRPPRPSPASLRPRPAPRRWPGGPSG